MDIRERVCGSVVVLDLSGRLIVDHEGLLKDKVNSLLLQGRSQVLLNCAGISFMDSSGLGRMVASYTTVTRQGGQIKLVNLTNRVRDLMTISKLLTVFEVFESEADALESFGSMAAV